MSSEVVARPAGYTGDEPPAPQPTAAGPARGVPGPIRRNGLFLLVLVLGIALRALTQLAYQPALLYVDSFRYLARVQILNPAQLDPLGYSVVLRPLLAIGGLGTVTLVQHVVGLLIGVLIYVLACRYGARRWLAGLAAAPILLDGYQLQIEQNIMADVWMELFLVVALWLLLARGVPGPVRAGLAGVVLTAAVLTRTISLAFVPVALVYLITVGGGRLSSRTKARLAAIGKRTAAFGFCFAVTLFCYAGYFHRWTDHWGLTTASGNLLYGRAAEVVDCSTLHVDEVLEQLCPEDPPDARQGLDYYYDAINRMSDGTYGPLYVPPGETTADMQRQFSDAVLQQQPLAMAKSVLGDFLKGFSFTKSDELTDVPVERWQFQTYYPLFPLDSDLGIIGQTTEQYSQMPPTVNYPIATILRAYQLHGGYLPGTVSGVFALVGIVGGFVRRRSGIRAATLLVTLGGLAILFGSAVYEFSWRYQLPGLIYLPLAGVLGLTAFLGPLARPKPRPRRSALADFPDDVDYLTLVDFAERHHEPSFAPVLVVIAAYNEADGIGDVLDRLPKQCCDLDVDVLVVCDGCSDDTPEIALAHGVYTAIAPANRGQGAALRLGYRLAERYGAQFVITTDADGQYDNDEMPLLLRPLIDGDADFVTGSRRLGSAANDDRVRWLGVRVFAALASVLTLHKITDTSFGFRGMRTSLAGSIRLRQPQYQASELLLGALANGARYLEQPMTMRTRSAGTTKKGSNFVYGRNYARVMTGTWLREYLWYRGFGRLRRRPATSRTPAGRAARI